MKTFKSKFDKLSILFLFSVLLSFINCYDSNKSVNENEGHNRTIKVHNTNYNWQFTYCSNIYYPYYVVYSNPPAKYSDDSTTYTNCVYETIDTNCSRIKNKFCDKTVTTTVYNVRNVMWDNPSPYTPDEDAGTCNAGVDGQTTNTTPHFLVSFDFCVKIPAQQNSCPELARCSNGNCGSN